MAAAQHEKKQRRAAKRQVAGADPSEAKRARAEEDPRATERRREVFVRPLPLGTTEAELREFLETSDGVRRGLSIERLRVLTAQARGGMCIAFVVLRSVAEAERCVAEWAGAHFGDKALVITEARNNNLGDADRPKEPCMFFAEGKCSRGDRCAFRHDPAAARTLSRRLAPCRFYAWGHCAKGAECKFSHAEAEESDGGQDAVTLERDPAVTLPILYEDDELLAVNKPAGVLTHPSPGSWESGTVAHGLVGLVPDKMMRERGDHSERDSFIPRCIVHRLDGGTTGLLLVAKTPAAQRSLTHCFKAADKGEGAMRSKTYVALLQGHPGGEARAATVEIAEPIGRDPEDRRRMAVTPEGKAARSTVRVLRYSERRRLALVTVELHTGRMHQIRVHCASRGAPVCCDPTYGDRGDNEAFLERFGPFERLRPMLHAWALELPHPCREGEPLRLAAPLPEDMGWVARKVWPDLPSDPARWREPRRRRAVLVD
eukprot:TRINITY_DN50855_c0_g1_i1.p1 TRINITY_DN50855_c0_g1~~TRINITY_DN50855_c0_g1_i1.p1  ORF type:complete len:487 (+),score=154.56 TRINITY_DN50855_c0_g1_i1:69-1529(+)